MGLIGFVSRISYLVLRIRYDTSGIGSADSEFDFFYTGSRAQPLELSEKLRAAQPQFVHIRRRIDNYFQLSCGDIGQFAVPAELCGQQPAPGAGDRFKPGLPWRNPPLHKLPDDITQHCCFI